jgi:Flp pilus assembly protein TadD
VRAGYRGGEWGGKAFIRCDLSGICPDLSGRRSRTVDEPEGDLRMTTVSRHRASWPTCVLVAALVTACTSSGHRGSSAGSSAPVTGPTGSATGSPVRPSSSAASTSPASSGTPADASTTRQITAAYQAFFDGRSTTAQSEAALQNGAAFHAALVQQSKNSHASGSGVKVDAVSVNGDLGFVTYTITQNGAPLLSHARGYALRQGGRWKVAAITFCTLLQLQGGAPITCNNPTLTSLPQ